MVNFETGGKGGPSDDAVGLAERLKQLNYLSTNLSGAIFDLAWQENNDNPKTAQLDALAAAQQAAEPLVGQPVRGTFRGQRYFIDHEMFPDRLQSQEFPRNFSNPSVVGLLAGIERLPTVAGEQIAVVAINPIASTEDMNIRAYYERVISEMRLRQPFGFRDRNRDKRLWLPVVSLPMEISIDGDYLQSQLVAMEGFRAALRSRHGKGKPLSKE